ncbi:MAG: hypothetical protein COC04_00845 [Gammaproteobacteria bacterium]|nr:MAG: hypothetical protein COC04_00845 [Gammaproteobacteria bacterium]
MEFNRLTQGIRDFSWNIIDNFNNPSTRRQALRIASISLSIIILFFVILMLWWDKAPNEFNPVQTAQQIATSKQHKFVTGYTSTVTLITLTDNLLNKSGGYLSNDVMPPSIWMDNIPNWEFGVLVQIRDFSRALRNDISRSQSQSLEDPDLAIAEPQFNFNSESWLFPPTESEYQKGIKALESYLTRLSSSEQDSSQFYARADNLADWLAIVEKRLGSLSQRLSASVGQTRINTDLAGDPAAIQSTPAPAEIIIKTPWAQIDDVFYESRGTSWALIHLLKAVEYDFADILQKKNALISLRQIIRELEATQESVWSPMILNGSGFGLVANHSLVMASYISRANAAIIDLRSLLSQG